MWNSAYSVKYMYDELEKTDYEYDHKMLLYPEALERSEKEIKDWILND